MLNILILVHEENDNEDHDYVDGADFVVNVDYVGCFAAGGSKAGS